VLLKCRDCSSSAACLLAVAASIESIAPTYSLNSTYAHTDTHVAWLLWHRIIVHVRYLQVYGVGVTVCASSLVFGIELDGK
jgi:hypothetical protein